MKNVDTRNKLEREKGLREGVEGSKKESTLVAQVGTLCEVIITLTLFLDVLYTTIIPPRHLILEQVFDR